MRRRSIIVLEDDEFSISVIRRTLDIGGYDCIHVATEQDALRQFAIHDNTVLALIADLILPACRGTDVALKVSAAYPTVPILFVSATPFDDWTEADQFKKAKLGASAFLAKPFQPRALLSALAAVVSRPAPAVAPTA